MSYQKPYYNRYTQSGDDARGYKTGYPKASPGDVTTGRTRGWKFVQFVGGRAPQPPELNEMQSIWLDQLKDVGDHIRRNGQTTGLQLRINKNVTPAVVHIEWSDPSVPGKVYADGLFHIVPETTLAIAQQREEIVAVRITRSVTTEIEDPALNDPTTGSYNSGKAGAYRWSYIVEPVIKNEGNRDVLTDTYDVWVLQDGVLKSSANDEVTAVDQRLISYTADLQGDCLVRGMRVKATDKDTLDLLITIDRGRAYVGGKPVGYQTTTTLTTPKAKVQRKPILSETIPLTAKLVEGTLTLNDTYAPSRLPLYQVTKLSVDTVIKKQGLYNGGDPFTQDLDDPLTVIISNNPPYGPVTSVVSVFDTVANAFLAFAYVPSKGFKLSAPPSGPVKVVWTYRATLVGESDYTLSADKRAVVLANQYPNALDQTLNALNPVNGDKASYLFPGIGSTRLASDVAIGDDVIPLVSVSGLVAGQSLTLAVRSASGVFSGSETVVVESLNAATNQVQLAAPLTANHGYLNTSVYTDVDFIGVPAVSAENAGIVDYEYMLDRVDIVYVDADNNIVIQPGQANVPAFPPTLPIGVLPLARLDLPANGDASSVKITAFPVQAQSQQDINRLLARMDQAEYNTSILNLQLATYNKSTAAGLALRSILTDAFVNSNTAEVGLTPVPLQRVMIDPDQGTLSPTLTMDQALLAVDTAASTCYVGNRTATMGFLLTGSNDVANTVFTDVEPVRSNSNLPRPTLVVANGPYTGPADRGLTWPFFNPFKGVNEPIPATLEGGFWRTRQNRVPWLENQSLFVPELTLTLSGRNFPAGTYSVTIDGKPITGSTVVVGTTETFSALNIQIPSRTISGHNSRTISVVDGSGTVIASTVYGVTPSEAQFLPTAHDSLAVSPYVPVAQVFTLTADRFIGGVKIHFDAKGTGWLDVELRSTDDEGRPGTEILARKRLLPADVILGEVTEVTFEDPVFGPAGRPVALCLVGQHRTDGTQWAVKKAVAGRTDANGNIVAAKPLTQGALYTSADGGGFVVQQESTMTFTLLECSFRADKRLLQFQPVSSTALGNISMLIARAQQLVPRGSVLSWSVIIDSETLSPVSITLDADGTVDPLVLPRVASSLTLRAEFTSDAGHANISAQVGVTSVRALMFKAATQSVYVSRMVSLARPASATPAYTKSRVTLQLLSSLLASNSVRVRFSSVDDVEGLIYCDLSGTPEFGDQVSVAVDGSPYTFTYEPAGVPSLAELVSRLAFDFNGTYSGVYEVRVSQNGADQRLSFRRFNGSAFVLGDLTVSVVVAGDDLATTPMSANYKLMTRDDSLKQVIDTRFTEYTFDLSGLTPEPAFTGGPDIFRVQVELLTVNPLLVPVIRNLACVVST